MVNKKQRLKLKQAAHHLNPVVLVGQNGLTDAVHKELAVALDAHELIKIRVNAEDREARGEMIKAILSEHKAELIQQVGHTATIYRKSEE